MALSYILYIRKEVHVWNFQIYSLILLTEESISAVRGACSCCAFIQAFQRRLGHSCAAKWRFKHNCHRLACKLGSFLMSLQSSVFLEWSCGRLFHLALFATVTSSVKLYFYEFICILKLQITIWFDDWCNWMLLLLSVKNFLYGRNISQWLGAPIFQWIVCMINHVSLYDWNLICISFGVLSFGLTELAAANTCPLAISAYLVTRNPILGLRPDALEWLNDPRAIPSDLSLDWDLLCNAQDFVLKCL